MIRTVRAIYPNARKDLLAQNLKKVAVWEFCLSVVAMIHLAYCSTLLTSSAVRP